MNRAVNKFGYLSALIAFLATVAFVIVQLLQVMSFLSFPWDEILIYGTSLCIVIPFVLAMLALHYTTPEDKRLWTHGGLIFSILYSVFVTANYVVQLATVLPMKLRGQGNAIAILDQTPHSMFWNFDALGYIFMGLAMLVTVPAFKKDGFQKWVRFSFLANALVTPLISFVYFNPAFSDRVLLLGLPWGLTAPLAMLMLAFLFYKNNYLSHVQPRTT